MTVRREFEKRERQHEAIVDHALARKKAKMRAATEPGMVADHSSEPRKESAVARSEVTDHTVRPELYQALRSWLSQPRTLSSLAFHTCATEDELRGALEFLSRKGRVTTAAVVLADGKRADIYTWVKR